MAKIHYNPDPDGTNGYCAVRNDRETITTTVMADVTCLACLKLDFEAIKATHELIKRREEEKSQHQALCHF